eukprot:TRINITY_DN6042_c0_g1_i1.p1 TRINITY_DN6042_c0_g1~~TRINITY_DN6042_c0_g1_i1.p1  ORF type:complete len:430 (-),score=123.04 TRINITY_DN6042_c0_g1_i1:200-1489(-)
MGGCVSTPQETTTKPSINVDAKESKPSSDEKIEVEKAKDNNSNNDKDSNKESLEDDPNDTEDEKIKKQRRRLSVAPAHVESKDAEKKETGNLIGDFSNLSSLERKAYVCNPCYSESRKGVVPYNKSKPNQDRFVAKLAIHDDPSISMFGVMDGHGEFGHFVAQFVQEKLPANIAAQEELRGKTSKAIFAAVKRTCEQLVSTAINIAFSGTTCVFGVRVDNKLYVANIGDSRCVLCRKLSDEKFQVIPLSVDQKPDVPKEKERIMLAGGRVEPLPGPVGEDCGPPRVWLAEVDVPGLAMSRSIGDEVSQTVGVISIPEIIEHDLQESDLFALWASDGVWEFLTNEQVCDIVWKNRSNWPLAVSKLVEEAANRWKQEEEVIDDITVVLVNFQVASSSTTSSSSTSSITTQTTSSSPSSSSSSSSSTSPSSS